MIYLSQILNKKIQFLDQPFGKILDLVIAKDKQIPIVSKVVINYKHQKYSVPASETSFNKDNFILKNKEYMSEIREENDFYLAENLLDKQVIDINGKHLIRVNDVLIKINGEIKVEGIDVGPGGIIRRLGLGFINIPSTTIPWSIIEAFDYHTGNVQIRLEQSKLNTLHSAEIADILEEAGTKERLGLLHSLDVIKAASAISEADTRTQSAIFKQVSTSKLKNILEKMRISAIANVINKLNPKTIDQIFKALEVERASKVKKLLIFEDDEAGGLMDFSFFKQNGQKTINEMLEIIRQNKINPEAVVVVDDKEELIGAITVNNLLGIDPSMSLRDNVKRKIFATQDTPFSQILRLFAKYNLRILPVVDKEKKVIGSINIDNIMRKIQEEEEK